MFEFVPFPKFQDHDVGLPVERSEKLTKSGAQPEIGVAEKFAVGRKAKLFKLRIVHSTNTPAVFTEFRMFIGIGFCL